MIRNAALAFLLLGDLVAWPAFGQDDLLTRAQQLFKPIPTAPPELRRKPEHPREGRTRKDALL